MPEPNIPEDWPSVQPKGLPDHFDFRADTFDAELLGGDGDALVISDPGEEGAYVASTLSANDYLDSRA